MHLEFILNASGMHFERIRNAFVDVPLVEDGGDVSRQHRRASADLADPTPYADIHGTMTHLRITELPRMEVELIRISSGLTPLACTARCLRVLTMMRSAQLGGVRWHHCGRTWRSTPQADWGATHLETSWSQIG